MNTERILLNSPTNNGLLSKNEYISKYYQNEAQIIEKVILPSNLGMTTLFKNEPSFELTKNAWFVIY